MELRSNERSKHCTVLEAASCTVGEVNKSAGGRLSGTLVEGIRSKTQEVRGKQEHFWGHSVVSWGCSRQNPETGVPGCKKQGGH